MTLEDGDEERARKTDDVEIVALDSIDEAAAEPLDRIRTGPPLPLAARHVLGDELRA